MPDYSVLELIDIPYDPDHVFGEWFSFFMSSQAKKLGWVIVTSCSVLEYCAFNRLHTSNKNKC
jgi:hypothetical protein